MICYIRPMTRKKAPVGEGYASDLWGDPTPLQIAMEEQVKATLHAESVVAAMVKRATAAQSEQQAQDLPAERAVWRPYADD